MLLHERAEVDCRDLQGWTELHHVRISMFQFKFNYHYTLKSSNLNYFSFAKYSYSHVFLIHGVCINTLLILQKDTNDNFLTLSH